MSELTKNEEDILEAAEGLLRESRFTVRYLDVIRKAVMAYTLDERVRLAWCDLEASASALGREQDPEAYCGECDGKGEGRRDQALEECDTCAGTGFIGYPRRLAMHLYSPGDETLEPLF